MTEEERIASLHRKMAARRRMKERRKTALYGTASCLLLTCMVLMIGIFGGTHQASTASLYSGATLLFEDVGGYVLMAVVAFMAGVCVTVVCMRNRHHEDDGEETRTAEKPTGDAPKGV